MSTRGWEHATAEDVRDRRIPPKPSKYRNVKTTVDNIVFDSAKEAKRYSELKVLERAGVIRRLLLQQRFSLDVHTGVVNAPPVTIGEWWADFTYEAQQPDGTWCDVFEDVKGMATLPLARWKQKHVRAQYGITVTEVR